MNGAGLGNCFFLFRSALVPTKKLNTKSVRVGADVWLWDKYSTYVVNLAHKPDINLGIGANRHWIGFYAETYFYSWDSVKY